MSQHKYFQAVITYNAGKSYFYYIYSFLDVQQLYEDAFLGFLNVQ